MSSKSNTGGRAGGPADGWFAHVLTSSRSPVVPVSLKSRNRRFALHNDHNPNTVIGTNPVMW